MAPGAVTAARRRVGGWWRGERRTSPPGPPTPISGAARRTGQPAAVVAGRARLALPDAQLLARERPRVGPQAARRAAVRRTRPDEHPESRTGNLPTMKHAGGLGSRCENPPRAPVAVPQAGELLTATLTSRPAVFLRDKLFFVADADLKQPTPDDRHPATYERYAANQLRLKLPDETRAALRSVHSVRVYRRRLLGAHRLAHACRSRQRAGGSWRPCHRCRLRMRGGHPGGECADSEQGLDDRGV